MPHTINKEYFLEPCVMKVPWMQLGCIAYSLTMPHTIDKEYFLEPCMMEVPWKHLGCYYQVKCRDIHRLKKPTQIHWFTWRNRSTGMTYSELACSPKWEQRFLGAKTVCNLPYNNLVPRLGQNMETCKYGVLVFTRIYCFFREIDDSSGALNYREFHNLIKILVWFFSKPFESLDTHA